MKSKKIANYPNYTIYEDGRIISHAQNTPRELKPQKVTQSRKKYLQVRLYGDDARITKEGRRLGKLYYVHRLMWETFKGKIPKDKEIDHIDNDPHNNHINNLQLISRGDNMLRYIREEYNEENARARKEEIRKLYKELGNISEVARRLDLGYTSVWRVCKNLKIQTEYKNGKRTFYYIKDDEDYTV